MRTRKRTLFLRRRLHIPRLKAQGADLSKIRILDGFRKVLDGKDIGEFELSLQDVIQIRDAILQTESETGLPVRLVVVDPVSNHWGGIKENDNTQVRKVLKPLQRLTEEMQVAFLLITHFGKEPKIESADKVIGSIAITAAARTVWYLYRDKENEDTRYFVPSKDNVLNDPTGVEFTIDKGKGGLVKIIDANLKKKADDIEAEQFSLLQDKIQGRGRQPGQINAAALWLQEWIEKSPLDGLGIGSFVNKKNIRIVPIDDYMKLLRVSSCQDWRMILALVRIGGLRCPSEVLALRWDDVDWERNCLYVQSPKTEHHQDGEGRTIPLFPELRMELRKLFCDQASEDREFVINRYRSKKQNLRTTLKKMFERAGLEIIPQPFRNMRMTRSNEVYNRWGAFKESQWIGHSSRVRADHYLMLTDDDYLEASRWESRTASTDRPNRIRVDSVNN